LWAAGSGCAHKPECPLSHLPLFFFFFFFFIFFFVFFFSSFAASSSQLFALKLSFPRAFLSGVLHVLKTNAAPPQCPNFSVLYFHLN